MNDTEDMTTLKFKYRLAQYKETKSVEAASEIADMILGGELKITVRTNTKKLVFLPMSQYSGSCAKCGERYHKGDPIFYKQKRCWHIGCANNEELSNSYLRTCLRKGIIEFDIDTLVKKNLADDILRGKGK